MVIQELAPDSDFYFPSKLPDPQGDPPPSDTHPHHDIASCALVSRDWSLVARRHLFSTFPVTFRPGIKRIEAREDAEESVLLTLDQSNRKTLEAVVEFFKAHPHLVVYIRRLIFQMDHFRNELGSLCDFPHPSAAASIIGMCDTTRLRSIEFRDVILDALAPPNYVASPTPAWVGSLEPVEQLTITFDRHMDESALRSDNQTSDDYVDPIHIRNILTLFRTVNSVYFSNIQFESGGETDERKRALPKSLQITDLVLESVFPLSAFHPVGPSNISFSRLECLEIDCGREMTLEDISDIRQMLLVCSKTLQDFSMEVYEPTALSSLNFSTFESLSNVTFVIPVYPRGYVGRHSLNAEIWSRLITLLSERPPPNLAYFQLNIDQGGGRLKSFDWNTPEIRQLETVLANMASLQIVTIEPRFTPDIWDDEETMGEEDEDMVEDDAEWDISHLEEGDWIDLEFSLKLFAGLAARNRLYVRGYRSFYRGETFVNITDMNEEDLPDAVHELLADASGVAFDRQQEEGTGDVEDNSEEDESDS